MKIQNLAVIFIIIMLPISMVLTSYVQNQVQTVELQISYDTKLKNATYDALKAFQLNTINNSFSDLTDSKIRDIEASVNTFFNSMANNFNMAGYNQDILQNYVPAIVYTMYDGYYIYTPFRNDLSHNPDDAGETYQNDEKLYSLKPYVHYSCRYKNSSGSTDVVITYSLDNCITVEGIVNNEGVYKTGYLIDENNIQGSGNNLTYRGASIIPNETLTENVALYSDTTQTQATIGNYIYNEETGVKNYLNNDGTWFSIGSNATYSSTSASYDTTTNSAIEYYENAREFTHWVTVESGLANLTTSNAVDDQGNSLSDEFGANVPIFGDQGNAESIEDYNSSFNQHRLAVIRYSIEKNLSIAIANYNNYTNVTTDFQMPELREDEWDKILNNISIISFMQGLSIGGKIYNGYSIVTNTKNEEVVNTDSIYIITSDGNYHRATDQDLVNNNNGSYIRGAYLNIDFERKSITNGTSTTYYYPHTELGCYTSIVNQTNVNVPDNIYQYMEDTGGMLASVYFTALGRERFNMYRTNPITTDWN